MSAPLSVVFLGTPDFAVSSLEALIADPAFVVSLVVTQPDRPVGRAQKVEAPPVKKIAEQRGISVLQPENINKENPFRAGAAPDFIVVVAYGQILSDEILAAPRIAAVNVHASLLPRWRGASPIQHAILAGDAESGVTIQKMVKELDAGAILSQRSTPIDARETAETLHDRLAAMGAELLVDTLKKPLDPREQDASHATLCRKLARKDGIVDPATMTAADIDRRVRALVPWPGVLCTIDGEDVKVIATSLEPTPGGIPMGCKDGTTLFVTTLQPHGGKPMTGEEWQRGRR